MIYNFFKINYKKCLKFYSIFIFSAVLIISLQHYISIGIYGEPLEQPTSSETSASTGTSAFFGTPEANDTYYEKYYSSDVLDELNSNNTISVYTSGELNSASDPTLPENSSSTTEKSTFKINSLYAKYACLMDGDNHRVLIGKDADKPVPMASTTKIMTCIIALEYGYKELPCTTSAYAASMPDVQLNLKKGDSYPLIDLLYSLMLKSHNDSAVVIAENVAYNYISNVKSGKCDDIIGINDSLPDTLPEDTQFIKELSTENSKLLVGIFAKLMNYKAQSLGCTNTYFITPNGLDAKDDYGQHSTTARELAVIMDYCITNEDFLTITQTKGYSFGPYTISNANAFLSMYPDIISGKTGFTGNAGYCYVCAYKQDGRTFIVTLLACGWPNNKTYKWHDAKLLLNEARNSYYPSDIVEIAPINKTVAVKNGTQNNISLRYDDAYSALISKNDTVNVVYNVPEYIEAPVSKNDEVGNISVYINDELFKSIPLYANEDVIRTDWLYYLKTLINPFLFIDK